MLLHVSLPLKLLVTARVRTRETVGRVLLLRLVVNQEVTTELPPRVTDLRTLRTGKLFLAGIVSDAGVVLRGVEASIGVVISLQHHNNSVNCRLQKLLLRLSQKS